MRIALECIPGPLFLCLARRLCVRATAFAVAAISVAVASVATVFPATAAAPVAESQAGKPSAGAAPADGAKASVNPPRTSKLWGRQGELWSPESRLPDFSLAGYRRGEEPYRVPKESISVKDFGAVGDGRTDDTAAFRRAFEAGGGKRIVVPPGRYVLTDILRMRASNTVLRGAGPGRTVLIFSKPGIEIEPRISKTDGGQPTSNWSWAGGMIVVGGPMPRSEGEVKVVGAAKRGQMQLALEANSFRPGEEVMLALHDDDEKSLVKYLYCDQTGDISGLNRWRVVQVFRVTGIKGNAISLDRPLRFDVRAAWKPTVERFRPSVTDVGIESLSFEFPLRPYEGHFKEVGFNPVEIARGAAHCWLREIVVRNADSGPYVFGSFCTVENIRLQADEARLSKHGHAGHHGISLQGNDLLCRDFTIETRFIHDLTVQSSIGCVFARGKAVDLCMDHHRWASYENLFTDIDAGKGTRLFASSGGGNRGNHSGAGATFWNIRAEKPSRFPNWGIDAITIVALPITGGDSIAAALPSPTSQKGRWLELIPPGEVEPRNLYDAMKARRAK